MPVMKAVMTKVAVEVEVTRMMVMAHKALSAAASLAANNVEFEAIYNDHCNRGPVKSKKSSQRQSQPVLSCVVVTA